ncbi:hypothetical protein THAOC_08520, partial [Thalassiosira oceanica]
MTTKQQQQKMFEAFHGTVDIASMVTKFMLRKPPFVESQIATSTSDGQTLYIIDPNIHNHAGETFVMGQHITSAVLSRTFLKENSEQLQP